MCLDLGMPKSFMTELRKGRHQTIKGETAQKIADYFGVPVEQVLAGDDCKAVIPTESEAMLLDLFRLIPDEDKKDVLNLIRAAIEKIDGKDK